MNYDPHSATGTSPQSLIPMAANYENFSGVQVPLQTVLQDFLPTLRPCAYLPSNFAAVCDTPSTALHRAGALLEGTRGMQSSPTNAPSAMSYCLIKLNLVGS